MSNPTDFYFTIGIAVIGAGIGGLSAALRMADTGRDVTVIDPKPNPYAPLPTLTRQTIPFVETEVLKRLGLPKESYPEIKYVRIGNKGWVRRKQMPPHKRERGVDALSVRRTLLQKAQEHPRIDLVEGKAVALDVESVRGRGMVRGVRLVDGRVLETGKNGLVVVATGRDKNVFDSSVVREYRLPSPLYYNSLGGYIASPALEDCSRDTGRSWHDLMGAALFPSEQIEDGGTNFATFFVTDRTVLDRARGGNANVLATMQEITRGTKWEKFYRGAKIDRVLLYTSKGNVLREPKPSVDGMVLVGDARVDLNPGTGKGTERIDFDTALLQTCISTRSDLTEAANTYNSFPLRNIRILSDLQLAGFGLSLPR